MADLPRWPGPARSTSDIGLGAAQPLLEAALAAGGTAAWHTNLVTRQRWWSKEMFRMHGLADATAVPLDYMDLVHPDDRPRVQTSFAELLEHGAHRVQYRVVWPDGSIHWLEGVGRSQKDDQDQPVCVSGVCSQIDGRKREEADLRFLAQASAELARSTDYEETLRRVAAMSVPHFADWCAVDMLDETGELKRVAVAHVEPPKIEMAKDLHRRYPPDPRAPAGVWNILKTGQPELLSDIPDELLQKFARDAEHLEITRSLGLRSYMGVPMVGAQRVLGVITFVSSDSGRVYGQEDLNLAMDLAGRSAVAVQNAELFRALQRSQARQGFLLGLTDVLRRTGTKQEALEAVSQMLGRHFGCSRVGYGHVDEAQDLIDYDVCWTDGSVPPLLGRFPASAFGPQVIGKLRAGETVAIADVRDHPLTSELRTIQTSVEVDTRGILVVPLFRAGRLRTIVYLNQQRERQWSDEEISLMQEVAERTRELIERDRAETALRHSEARWRGLFERMAEGFFVAECLRDGSGRIRDFRFLQVNPAFEKLTGVARSAAVGRPVSDVIPGLPSGLIERYAHVVETGEPAEFEMQVPALNDRWYEARAQRVGPDQFSVLFLEVSERKRAELELQRSADRYRTLFESIDEGFCILEVQFDERQRPVDYRFLEVNPAFERQSGLSGALGRTIRELVPDIERAYIDTYGRVALTGEPVRFESLARPLGRWFDAFAFRVGEPALHRVALLFTDITERKVAQDALQERESQLREAQQLAGIGSWYWDRSTDMTDASPELLRIYGVPEGGSLPAFADQRGTVYPAEDWDRLNDKVSLALSRGHPYSLDLRAFRGAEEIWVTARGAPVYGDDGQAVGLRGTVQDITERKLTEQALREADVRKDEFLATLAHELRNPLAPLRNGLAILRKSEAANPSSVRARELMERQLGLLVRLVDDLLDVSRVSQGKVTMKKAATSLQSVVDQALETAKPLIDAAGHRLTVSLPSDPILLMVDPARMAQVLSNLLNNAAKYTSEGGNIGLSAGVDDGSNKVRICVEDDGVGIPPAMLTDIFNLFTQVGSAVDRAQGGLGIGLSLARRLVELHGGTIRAESEGELKGSRFVLELPLLDAPHDAAASAAPNPCTPKQSGRSVLIVDDNVDAAETLALLLELDGHQVQVVHTGREALEAALTGAPDLIFLDIGLPDLSGYEVAARLRAIPALARTFLVAVTGWGAEQDRARARSSGIDMHLTKPVSHESLEDALSRCVPAARHAEPITALRLVGR